ncbi:MAG TPA: hypothetical protein VGG16_21450 [Streptosporangiaceae bacterium]
MDRAGRQGGHDLSDSALVLTKRRRPVYIWAPPFVVLLVTGCVRNRFLFSQKLYEQGDAGANSILITTAKHFTLLIGNYSREGFNHPGPAFMYVQAAGEWLLRDVLHVVPTAWNAHMLAVFALDCALVSIGVLVSYGWTGSAAGALVATASLTVLAIWQPAILNSDWMPYLYVLPYVVFLLAAASVMAGAARDVWIMTLAGWLLIHGHACFLFFVPLITAFTVAMIGWRHGPRAVLARFAGDRRLWIPVAAISALFLLPIVVNLALRWPGDFGTYIAYGKSGQAGGHGPSQIVHYLLWFWWPHGLAALAALALYGAALAATVLLTRDTLRENLLALLVINLVSTAGVIAYAAVGIDNLSQYYIAYFYWSAPLIAGLALALAVICSLPASAAVAVSAAAAVASATVLAVLPGTLASTHDIDEALPGAVAALSARAPGTLIVLTIQHPAWVQTAGFLVQAERTGVHVCVDGSWYTFLFSRQFICTRAQLAHGVRYQFDESPAPAGAGVLYRFDGVSVVKA